MINIKKGMLMLSIINYILCKFKRKPRLTREQINILTKNDELTLILCDSFVAMQLYPQTKPVYAGPGSQCSH